MIGGGWMVLGWIVCFGKELCKEWMDIQREIIVEIFILLKGMNLGLKRLKFMELVFRNKNKLNCKKRKMTRRRKSSKTKRMRKSRKTNR